MVTVNDIVSYPPKPGPAGATFHSQSAFSCTELNAVHLWEQPSIWKCLVVTQLCVHPRGMNSVNNVHILIHLCISAGWAA